MTYLKRLAPLLLAVGLTVVFWHPLWRGHGLVGGDTYSYYFPQKAFYADELQAGRIPLWNPLVGHGYPVVAESQTGVFYPVNLVLYRFLGVNAAYNASQIMHYVGAFLATWLLARRLGLGAAAAALVALVFVYGWFPPRLCLEWAIIGGVYFPLVLWCGESYLQTGRRGWLVGLAMALGLHLLAGHYNLAFITVLTLAAWALLRLGYARDRMAPIVAQRPAVAGAKLLAAVVVGFALAAVQLLPTWELKQLSQRAAAGSAHDPGYGHIPPWYLSQVVAPWLWYAPDVDADQALRSIKTLTIASETNKVEAALYFGLLPLALAVGGLVIRYRRREGTPRTFLAWGLLGLAAVVYATGWLVPVTRHIPGFSFFMGPGRYGIVAALAVALLAGYSLDRWLSRRPRARWPVLVACVVFAATAFDLWFVRCHWDRTVEGAPAWYADMIEDPPINHRKESAVRRALADFPQPVRMLGPFQNMPTLTGFAMTPTYLGLSPAEYFDPNLTIPPLPIDRPPTADEVDAQVAWLRRAGVTHVLAEQPLDAEQWPVELVWSGIDALLNRAAARREPYFLYALLGGRGRAEIVAPSKGDTVRVAEATPGRVVIDAELQQPGEVVLTDLFYPGWSVTVDGAPAKELRVERMYRGVEVESGGHTVEWKYRPRSLYGGAMISGIAIAGLVVLLGWRRVRWGTSR